MMKFSKQMTKVLCVLLALCMLLATPVCYAENAADGVTADTITGGDTGVADDAEASDDSTTSVPGYATYYEENKDKTRPQNPVVVGAEDVVGTEYADKSTATYDGKDGVVISKENSWAEWKFQIPETGIYNLTPQYYPLAESGRPISLSITIDGKYLFTESKSLSLPRVWTDDVVDGKFEQDELGNNLRPTQKEAPRWMENSFLDELAVYPDPYFFYLEAGEHTIRFERVREALAIHSLKFSNTAAFPTYEEYVQQHANGAKPVGEALTLQAEHPVEKSDSSLYALTDHQDVGTTPNHPINMIMNTIGGSNWGRMGQYITWEVNVKEAGWYKVAMRARQNTNQGLISYRTLLVNGEIPFAEAVDMEFPYDIDWGVFVLGGEESPKMLYLEPGDKITLTIGAGKLCEVLRGIQSTVLELNKIYREIIVITGTQPDVFQDYYLEDKIPGISEMIFEQAEKLMALVNYIIEVTGKTSAQTSTISKVVEDLNRYAAKSYALTSNLAGFKSGIESLSSLLLTVGSQPVELDCFYFVPEETKIPSGKAGFWQSVTYSVQKFLGSFFNDYQGKSSEDTLEVWVSTGRDQLQILSSMVKEFTAETGINVRLLLVDTGGTLLKATLAGKGPDAALLVSNEYTIDLAMRGALVNLDSEKYNVRAATEGMFSESIWKRFYFNGGYYGIPETMGWSMLFYRTDIFKELDLEVPKTWDDLYEVLRTLQARNMNFAMPDGNAGNSGSIGIFHALLFQRGGNYYNKELTQTLFDQPEAYESFEQWAEFYSKYGVERSVDFLNRFRSGDVPIGYGSYSFYNTLMATAPELRGLWAMAPMPGLTEDNHVVSSDGSGCMLLTAAEKRGRADSAYKFLSWWTATEQQIRYGSDLEATMGIAARYTPASIEAFRAMGWTEEELQLLEAQRVQLDNVYEVPGEYLVARSLTSALRAVLDQNVEPRRALAQYNRDINAEIKRKRKEFNLD